MTPKALGKAHIPPTVTFQTKPDIALSLHERCTEKRNLSGFVLADGAYGTDGKFPRWCARGSTTLCSGEFTLDTKVQLIRNEEECVSVKDLLAQWASVRRRHMARREQSSTACAVCVFPVRIPKSKHQEWSTGCVPRIEGNSGMDQ